MMLKSIFNFFLFVYIPSLVLTLGCKSSYALPLTSSLNAYSEVGSVSSSEENNFTAMVAVGNCSGALIRFKNMDLTKKGIVLTNGHCIKVNGRFLRSDEVIVNGYQNLTVKLLNSNSSIAGIINVSKIIYATMTGTDLALLELSMSYNKIFEKMNIKPIELATTAPQEGDPIGILSGFWKTSYSCSIEKVIPNLKEANWVWHQSIRYSESGCETKGGTSGSPIINRITGEVIGVNNTINEKGKTCTLNNPCEVDASGNVEVIKGRAYGQQTYWIYSCLNSNFEFDLNLPNCLLYRGNH